MEYIWQHALKIIVQMFIIHFDHRQKIDIINSDVEIMNMVFEHVLTFHHIHFFLSVETKCC